MQLTSIQIEYIYTLNDIEKKCMAGKAGNYSRETALEKKLLLKFSDKLLIIILSQSAALVFELVN